MSFVSSLKRFFGILMFLVILTATMIFAFDKLVAEPIRLSTLIAQTVRTVVVLVSGSVIILFIRRSRLLMTKRVGAHAATVFQFFMVLVVIVTAFFAVLNILQVPSSTLILGGGAVSIVIGLVISTFVGNILAGTLVLTTRPFSVGDTVVVNNIPGKVVEITSMVTRIKTDIGGLMVIPNTAVMQGSIIVTKIPGHEGEVPHRLPYSMGDRVYTTYINGEGIVKEITPFQTIILLDSGKELTFLNTSVFSGSVAIAKVNSTHVAEARTTTH